MIKDRTLIGGVLLFAALAAGAYATQYSVANVQSTEATAKERYAIAQKQYEDSIGLVDSLAKNARTVDDWKDVLARASALPPDAKAYFTKRANIGMLERLALERDRLLFNAGELFAANEKDPGIPKVLEKAREMHEMVDGILKKVPADPKDPYAQLAKHYRLAYEKYRSLAFLDPKEHNEARNIIAEAVRDLQNANGGTPKINEVELFDELLYKRDKEEESKAGGKQPTKGRPRSLPSGRDPGPGENGPGMGPNRDQRY